MKFAIQNQFVMASKYFITKSGKLAIYFRLDLVLIALTISTTFFVEYVIGNILVAFF